MPTHLRVHTRKSAEDKLTQKKCSLFEDRILQCGTISFQEPGDFTGSMSLFKYSAEEKEEVQGLSERTGKRVCGRGAQPLMCCTV